MDTHILIRYLIDPPRLSRDQTRALAEAQRHEERIAVSAISLWEAALLSRSRRFELSRPLDEFFGDIESNPRFQLLPLSAAVAIESSLLHDILRDPADCIIVATARVHGLRLLTSDPPIIESNLVRTVA